MLKGIVFLVEPKILESFTQCVESLDATLIQARIYTVFYCVKATEIPLEDVS